MIRLLDKAKRIINEAKENDIDLEFNFNIDNSDPESYKDIVYNKNELAMLREELKKLEKEFNTKKSEKSVSDLSSFLDIKEDINGITTIISITNGYDINTLRQIVSALSNQLDNNFILLANINDDNSVNYIAKSNSNRVNCGDIVKDLAVRSSGNGGGNKSLLKVEVLMVVLLLNYLKMLKKLLEIYRDFGLFFYEVGVTLQNDNFLL